MDLKKINTNLQKGLIENGLTIANALQQRTFSTIKSGADCIIISPEKSGKTTTIVLNVVQQLLSEGEESPRALIFVENKEKMLEMEAIFEKLDKYNPLHVYGIHDKSDVEFDKNYISTGIDVLIGTPKRLNDMFTTAGYNVNRLKMVIVDDAETLLKARQDIAIMRISNSIPKAQRIIFSDVMTEKVDIFAEKFMIEPHFFNIENNNDDEQN